MAHKCDDILRAKAAQKSVNWKKWTKNNWIFPLQVFFFGNIGKVISVKNTLTSEYFHTYYIQQHNLGFFRKQKHFLRNFFLISLTAALKK